MANAAGFVHSIVTVLAVTILVVGVYGEENSPPRQLSVGDRYREQMRKLKALKASLLRRGLASGSSSVTSAEKPTPRIYRVTSYGADPTGKTDSTEAISKAFSDALETPSNGVLMTGIIDLGGARIDLEGGSYMISRPLQFPSANIGNVMIHGGTLRASDNFSADGYLIDLSAPNNTNNNNNNNQQLSSRSYNYEFVTLKDLLLDSNYRGGGISVIHSVRTNIDNCYITHFTTNGIYVESGHETYIRNSFLGQHITAGGDHNERNFSGTAISLIGNDNAVTDVVIFSAAIGVMVSGQANILTGVHCYNKATGLGGTGIYLKLPGLTQTRIVNSYLDYTGIVAEDPVQLHVSNCFFLGDAFISFKSIHGVLNGVTVVDNMFSGSNKGVGIVQLDERNGAFKQIGQVEVEKNNVRGMAIKSTVARGSVEGNGKSWSVDFSNILLFPNLIKHVQYSVSTGKGMFPKHALRSVSGNVVTVESDVEVPATVYVVVHQ